MRDIQNILAETIAIMIAKATVKEYDTPAIDSKGKIIKEPKEQGENENNSDSEPKRRSRKNNNSQHANSWTITKGV